MLYHDNEEFNVPAFWFNCWFDVSQGPNLAVFNHARIKGKNERVREGHYMLMAPTLHCGFYRIPENEDLIVGELNVGNATFPFYEQMFSFFDYYLKNKKSKVFKKLPKVQYYTMGANKWQSADAWPPEKAEEMILFLSSNAGANSLFGDGKLIKHSRSPSASDEFTYDPMNPVPALGGGVCCNKKAALGGSYDQRGIEARQDVLVYSSKLLEEDLEVTGNVRPIIYLSSSAKDTDLTVKLVDVHPDGKAYNVDDTIFRVRYREGYDKPKLMKENEVYEIKPTPLSTSHVFKKDHKIRIEISSSKFPQYMRNLNTGGNNYDEIDSVVADNTIHHSFQYPSRVVLSIIPK